MLMVETGDILRNRAAHEVQKLAAQDAASLHPIEEDEVLSAPPPALVTRDDLVMHVARVGRTSTRVPDILQANRDGLDRTVANRRKLAELAPPEDLNSQLEAMALVEVLLPMIRVSPSCRRALMPCSTIYRMWKWVSWSVATARARFSVEHTMPCVLLAVTGIPIASIASSAAASSLKVPASINTYKYVCSHVY